MSEQSKALRFASMLQNMGHKDAQLEAAGYELRRLHEENNALRRERDEARRTVRDAHEAGTRLIAQRDALLEALRAFVKQYGSQDVQAWMRVRDEAIAAIKAAEEGK